MKDSKIQFNVSKINKKFTTNLIYKVYCLSPGFLKISQANKLQNLLNNSIKKWQFSQLKI